MTVCGNRNAKRAQILNERLISNTNDDTASKQRMIIRAISKISLKALVSALLVFYLSFPKGAEAFYLSNVFNFTKNIIKTSDNLKRNDADQLRVNSKIETLDLSDQSIFLKSKGGAELPKIKNAVLMANEGPVSNIAKTDNYSDAGQKIQMYVVQKGDTLSEIAQKFGVSVNTIRWANNLDKRGIIKPGQELVILPIDGVKYKIKRGGTLRDVIKIVGGDLEEAAAFNGIDPDEKLKPGFELIIPHGEIKESKTKIAKTRSYVKYLGSGKQILAGYFLRPVKGGIRTQGLHGKNAVDIAGAYGQAIYAAAPGKVIISKWGAWNGGYGNYVVIAHPNGTQTLYAHLSKNLVRRGDYVQRGQIIGAMGSTGKSTGVHLHFQVRGARNPF